MNYKKLYNSIIENSKLTPRSKSNSYFELHHIFPRCLGGTDESANLTLLTAKEHFICHHLLTKIYSSSQALHFAFWMMLICESSNQQRHKTTGKAFQVAKENHARILSEKWKTHNPNLTNPKTGKNNPMYGVHRYGEANPFFGKSHSAETIKQIKQTKQENPKIWSLDEKQKLKDSSFRKHTAIVKDFNNNILHVQYNDPRISNLQVGGNTSRAYRLISIDNDTYEFFNLGKFLKNNRFQPIRNHPKLNINESTIIHNNSTPKSKYKSINGWTLIRIL